MFPVHSPGYGEDLSVAPVLFWDLRVRVWTGELCRLTLVGENSPCCQSRVSPPHTGTRMGEGMMLLRKISVSFRKGGMGAGENRRVSPGEGKEEERTVSSLSARVKVPSVVAAAGKEHTTPVHILQTDELRRG